MVDIQLLGGLAVTGSDSAAPRRRSLALVSLVAAAAPQPISRDKLVALLWPESDSTRARNSLRQALFALRRDLNEELFLSESSKGLELDRAHVRVDLWGFREAVARKSHADAVSAYRGPFLDGFHVRGLSAFSHWTDSERDRLARQYGQAVELLAKEAELERRFDDAISWRRRQVAADPFGSTASLGLLKSLAAAGDRAGALKYAAAHEQLVRRELESDPDPVITDFVASLRKNSRGEVQRPAMVPAPAYVPSPQSASSVTAVEDEGPGPSPALVPPVTARVEATPRRRIPGPVWSLGGAMLLLLTTMAGKRVSAARSASSPAASPIVVLGSGMSAIAGRDTVDRLVSCRGPACPAGSFPQAAFVVPAHLFYALPPAGTKYIAPVPDATSRRSPGYTCCTTAVFENAFRLPTGVRSATIVLSALADNQVSVSLNGVEFGGQKDAWASDNYAAMPSRFSMTFAPDPSGTNRLRLKLWDGGGALGLQYVAMVTYQMAASQPVQSGNTRK